MEYEVWCISKSHSSVPDSWVNTYCFFIELRFLKAFRTILFSSITKELRVLANQKRSIDLILCTLMDPIYQWTIGANHCTYLHTITNSVTVQTGQCTETISTIHCFISTVIGGKYVHRSFSCKCTNWKLTVS